MHKITYVLALLCSFSLVTCTLECVCSYTLSYDILQYHSACTYPCAHARVPVPQHFVVKFSTLECICSYTLCCDILVRVRIRAHMYSYLYLNSLLSIFHSSVFYISMYCIANTHTHAFYNEIKFMPQTLCDLHACSMSEAATPHGRTQHAKCSRFFSRALSRSLFLRKRLSGRVRANALPGYTLRNPKMHPPIKLTCVSHPVQAMEHACIVVVSRDVGDYSILYAAA